jgi:polysaccharide export outer membrane protein
MRSASLIASTSLVAVLLVAGCASLPADGPTGRAIAGNVGVVTGDISYGLVDLDYAMSERIKQASPIRDASLSALAVTATADTINIGDALQVTIYDPSGALFSSRTASAAASVTSGGQTLPVLMVDREGTIAIPFGGPVRVQGQTPREAAAAVVRSLRGKVSNPQVIVTVANSPANGIVVLGEVKAPGRASVQPGAENLLDAIAAAGGPSRNIDDITVSVSRGGQTHEAPLRKVLSSFDENIRLRQGDQINLVYTPRRYTSFGALGRTSQLEMPSGALTLTGALGQLGGLNPMNANARSVLVFRYERPDVAALAGVTQPAAAKGVPVVYRLNLAEPTGFFVASNFVIHPDDILYVPNSGTAEMRKFFDFVRSITSIAYDVRVAGDIAGN